MNLKFNWGHGITIFYIIFASTLIFVLIQSRKVKHNLVVDEYYKEDLKYQSTYDKLKNQILSNNIIIKTNKKNQQIEFNFLKAENPEGIIHFYRASDKDQDFNLPIESNNFTFETKALNKGKWKLKIDWKVEDQLYYHEKDIYL